jgi:phospholipid-binding lipoprotein MlaA
MHCACELLENPLNFAIKSIYNIHYFYIERIIMAKSIYLMILLALLSGGCATSPEHTADARDPWQGVNRKIYSFNNALDQSFLVPAATAYRAVTPDFAEKGVHNFFSNLNDLKVAFNNTLQFKFLDATTDVGRIVVNSTIGLLGLFDVASRMGLEKHDEDFGQTLGYWGVGTGPYVMLPFLGPSNLRDGPGKVVDSIIYPPNWADIDPALRTGLFALDLVNTRAELMVLEEKAGELSRDRYVFIRDAYLDRRKFLVNDGELSTDESLYDDLEEE